MDNYHKRMQRIRLQNILSGRCRCGATEGAGATCPDCGDTIKEIVPPPVVHRPLSPEREVALAKFRAYKERMSRR